MEHRDRAYSYPEIFGFFDPDALAPSPEPPAHVQAALEDVMGDVAKVKRDDGRPDLILRLHPWFRRWTLFSRQHLTAREKGTGAPSTCWQPVMVCCEPANPDAKHFEDLRPHDLRDRRYSEIWHSVGEYKLPDKRDFEDFREKCDRYYLSQAERAAKLRKAALARNEAYEAEARAYERDLCDYGYASYYRDLVRCIGGGQGLPFLPQTSLEMLEREQSLLEPVCAEDGRVLYYRRHSKEKLKRTLEDAQAVRKRWETALDEAGLSKAALAAAYESFSKPVPRELLPYTAEALESRTGRTRASDASGASNPPEREQVSHAPLSQREVT